MALSSPAREGGRGGGGRSTRLAGFLKPNAQEKTEQV